VQLRQDLLQDLGVHEGRQDILKLSQLIQ
jgi:hypothetical protein